MRALLATLALAAFAAPAFAAAPAACTAIPFQRVDDQIVLPIEVEGRSLRVLMDTGANLDLTLTESVLKSLRGVKATGKTARMGDASGAVRELPLHHMPALTFAGRSFADVEVMPDHEWGLASSGEDLRNPVDGVVGLGILGKQPFTLDLAGNTLYVGDRGQCADKLGKRWLEQPLELDKGGLNVTLSLDGQERRFLIDTAATQSFLLKASAPAGEKLQACQAPMPNGMPCLRLQPRQTLAGGQAIASPALYVLDFQGPPADGFLGSDYLQHFLVHLDVPGHVIALGPR